MAYRFDHENLDCHKMAVSTARWVVRANWPKGMAELKNQAVRSSVSVCLNIAEGCARGGGAGTNHFRIALGSAAETAAAIDIAFGGHGENQKEELRRIAVMVNGLIRNRG